MKHFLGAAATAAVVAGGGLAVTSQPARAYQIDCAILLCLSGGWPASAPCAAAKAEFIRRITPWPIEPPLQIWRCPMHAAYEDNPAQSPRRRLYDVALRSPAHPVPTLESMDESLRIDEAPENALFPAIWKPGETGNVSGRGHLQQIADYTSENGVADIDISDPAFDFVRSIRVYSVEYMRQRAVDRDNNYCRRLSRVRIGRYGQQGEFYWRNADPSALPDAYVGDEGWGEDCPRISGRSVFVDWSDHEGNYGYEQVNY
ncbi:hypothetical protein [Salipiger thiooxidans]|uniref:hypothetical protein n=1 Tax=Salipiger thiooxidans TaxID=282683 RepID=UPI001CD7683D|nr:hypothetical protein [Salipiger thiooxidans]MCA0849943.1 hypothetical protein [Salipiger thiooxidans]